MSRGRCVSRPILISMLVVTSIFQLGGYCGLRLNSSPSLPLGVYTVTSNMANLIEFCPAEPFASLAIDRGYRDRGACPDGATPLLKPVVAIPGDRVDLTEQGIAINGALLRNTAPLHVDTKCRPLQAWPPGHYLVAPGTVWVASTYNARSFDSRYFGPVSTTTIRNHVRPLLTMR